MSLAPVEIGCGIVGTAKSRYEEDVHHKPHSSVWGSWFDASSKQWGYSCCHSTDYKRKRCASSNSLLENAPDDMRTTESVSDVVQQKHIVVLSWIRETLRDWGNALTLVGHRLQSDPVLGQLARLQEAKIKLRPLICLLKDSSPNALDPYLLSTLHGIVDAASRKDFQAANQVYIDFTIGNAKWHEGFVKRMPPMGKVAGRISDHKITANKILTDPETVAYLQVMKRLVSIAQLLHTG